LLKNFLTSNNLLVCLNQCPMGEDCAPLTEGCDVGKHGNDFEKPKLLQISPKPKQGGTGVVNHKGIMVETPGTMDGG